MNKILNDEKIGNYKSKLYMATTYN